MTTLHEPKLASTAPCPGLPVFPFPIDQGQDFIPEYEHLRRENPVPKVELATGGEAYLICRHADARRVYDDPVFSRTECARPEVPVLLAGSKIPGVMLNMDIPEHTRLRRLVVQAFTQGAVARFRPRIQTLAEEQLDKLIAAGPPADFVAHVAIPYPARVICEILGVASSDINQLIVWLEHILSVSRYTPEQTAAAFGALNAYFADLIAIKRREPADDLVSGLIQARDNDDRLTESELVQMAWLLLGAGFETTANMLPNAIVTLARHPQQWALLRQRPTLVPLAVEELLRYVAVSQAGFERVATVDVELSGVRVPAGSMVLPVPASVNFDSSVFDDPGRFDVTRIRNPHLGFGHGPHRCVGAPLAQAEMDVLLRAILRRAPELRPAVADADLEWKQGMATRALQRLPVTW